MIHSCDLEQEKEEAGTKLYDDHGLRPNGNLNVLYSYVLSRVGFAVPIGG